MPLDSSFKALSVDQPFVEPLGQPPELVPAAVHKDKRPADTSFELKQPAEVAQLAFCPFLREPSEICTLVKATWREYKSGASTTQLRHWLESLPMTPLLSILIIDTFNKLAEYLKIAQETTHGQLNTCGLERRSKEGSLIFA